MHYMSGRNRFGSENSSTFLLRLLLASILEVKVDQREEALVS